MSNIISLGMIVILKHYRELIKALAVVLLILMIVPATILSQDGKYWVQKVYGAGLGDPFCYNPQNHNTIFCAPGSNQIWRSLDRGRNWHIFATVSGGVQIKAIHVNPLDTLQMIIGQEAGPPDRIMKTTNGGTEWYPTWYGEYSYYGRPLAYELAHPNLVYAEGWDSLWRSIDFGETWTFIRTTLNIDTVNHRGFDRWDCAVIRPDSPNVMYVGDVTNGLWKTYDSGYTWTRKHFHTGEYPIMGIDPFNPLIAYSAQWIGNRGFIKTTNGGETWFSLDSMVGRNTWGMAVSQEHPGFVCTGTYGDALGTIGGIYLSWDYGNNWTRTYEGLTNGSNYGMLALDSLTVFALQATGIWKLEFPTGTVSLTSPNGFENWYSSTNHSITWTSANISNVKLEYTTNNGSNWHNIISSVPASQGHYNWSIPNTPSLECRVRVSDKYNPGVYDISDTTFTISYASITLNSPNGYENWNAGSTQYITWSEINVSNIKLFYSIDDGNNWYSITSNYPAGSGSYEWIVPFTPSTMCRVKICHSLYTEISDMSDTVFMISTITNFLGQLTFEDNGGIMDTLRFGEMSGATDGIDTTYGELELSLLPGVDTFDVRWTIPGTNGVKLDIRDTMDISQPERIYTFQIQPGLSGFPFTVKWDPTALPSDVFTLVDVLTNGDSININMLMDSICVITNPNISVLQVIHKFLTTSLITVSNRWNMVSVPLAINDPSKISLFPTATSPAYGYSKGYVVCDMLLPGDGYWLKFNGDQIIPITGKPRQVDSIPVSQGWNMVGGLNLPVSVSEIVLDPPTMTKSNFFGYNNGYQPSEVLFPGKGYWIKVSESGKIIVSSSTLFSSLVNTFKKGFERYSKLIFTDKTGSNQYLFFCSQDYKDIALDKYEMPPLPPDGIFDIRFASNRILEIIPDKGSSEFPILLSSIEYPLSIKWETNNSAILTIDGKEIPLEANGSTQITKLQSKISLKSASNTTIPKAYKLEQNYPNPFNPNTVIRYQLPVDSRISLKVYNVLGKEVRTLVDEIQNAGYKVVSFNASNLPSGVYYYQIKAGTYNKVMKMLLVK